jgi:hypothetical protein
VERAAQHGLLSRQPRVSAAAALYQSITLSVQSSRKKINSCRLAGSSFCCEREVFGISAKKMWAARVPWTAAARYAAGACAASLAAPPPTDCDAVRRRLTPIGRFALLSETRDAPSVPAVLLELGGAPLAARDLERALADRVASVSTRLRSRVDAERLEFVEDLTTEEATPVVMDCVEIKILRRVRAESSRRPPRHRRDA